MDESPLKVSEVIQPQTIDLDISPKMGKDELIHHLIEILFNAGKLYSKEEFLKAVTEREKQCSTYMGDFIAIPHGKSDTVIQAGVAFGRCLEGIEYHTEMGGGTAKLIFLLAIPNSMTPNAYVAVLARLACLLVHDEFKQWLYEANDYEDVIQAIFKGEGLLESD